MAVVKLCVFAHLNEYGTNKSCFYGSGDSQGAGVSSSDSNKQRTVLFYMPKSSGRRHKTMIVCDM